MSRKKSISLADDSRARIPFAVIGVVLLTTSVVTVATLNNRPTPERDVAPDELNRRLTMASEGIISSAVDDAIAKAGVRPVTQADTASPVGSALQDSGGINNYNDNENGVFSNYVKLLIYKKVNRRLDQATQRKDSAESYVKANASLPPLTADEEQIEDALDRITVTVGPTDELARDEVRVRVSGVRHRVYTSTTGATSAIRSDSLQEVYRTEKSYTVTEETAIFEMHSQTEDYEGMLDNKMAGLMAARQWPLFIAKVTYERFAPNSQPVFSPSIFNRMLTLTEQEVFLNSANYNLQQAAFGTTDQSYPEMMDAGWACLGQELGGSLLSAGLSFGAGELAGASGVGDTEKSVTSLLTGEGYPAQLACTLVMYDAFPQATTTADAGMPSTFAFSPQTDWKPPENYAKVDQREQFDEYDPVAAAQAVERVSADPSNAPDDSGMSDGELEQRYENNGLMNEKEIEVDPFANAAYTRMFDKGNVFSDGTANRDVTLPGSGDHPYEIDTDRKDIQAGSGGSDSQIVSNDRERVVNRLRLRLINKIDSYEVTKMQYMSSENVYGRLIRQIELRSTEFIYDDIGANVVLQAQTVYGLRNEYIRRVVALIERAEKARQEGADKVEDKMNEVDGTDETSINEELVRGQLAIEDHAGNVGPERARELAEHANHATNGGVLNRWFAEDTERAIYTSFGNSLSGTDPYTAVGNGGLPTDEPVDTAMLFRFGMDTSPDDLDTIKKTTATGARSGDDATIVPLKFFEDYPPKTFPDDFEWPDDFPEDPFLTDKELPPPDEFKEDELPDDVANREEYDFPQDAQWPDDLPEDAGMWHVRPVEPEHNIYRVVNAQDTSISLGESPSGNVRDYIQIRDPESPDFDAELTEDAEDIVDNDDHDEYVITAVRVPQGSEAQRNPIGNAEKLLPPKLQEPPEESFRFDVHASPGYFSGLPISRQAEPGIRTAHGGITHARNSAFTAGTYQVSNAVPNFGIPILPIWWPFNLHFVSLNYWNTVARAEYARFELRAKPPDDESHDDAAGYTYADGLNGGPEKYVRLDQDVTIEVGDSPADVGRVEPIDVQAVNHYPFAMPGSAISSDGNWGLGDYVGSGYGPAHCTPTFQYVGPDIPVAPLMTGPACADTIAPGPIGQIVSGGLPGSRLDASGRLLFAAAESGKGDFPPASEEYQDSAEALCTRDSEVWVPAPIAPKPIREDEANCPDILHRDRYD